MYARNVADRTLTFGVSGLLARSSLVMYDHETNTLWSHVTGEALSGPLAGAHLQLLAAAQAGWGRWRHAHPDTLMLAFDPALASDPNSAYYRGPRLGVDRDQADITVDPRLKPKAEVMGLRVEGHVKAYSLATLARDRAVNDVVGGAPVVVVFDGASQSGAVFRRDPGGRPLTFKPGPAALELVDSETGSHWDGLGGSAVSGPLVGSSLEQIPVTYAFWFAWSSFYPETDLFA